MTYRIYRIKDSPRESFRWAPHTGGIAVLKSKDYELGGQVQAATPYAAWKQMAENAQALQPGDVLEVVDENGAASELKVVKYIGFEPAQWFVPAPRLDPAAEPSTDNSADLMRDGSEIQQQP